MYVISLFSFMSCVFAFAPMVLSHVFGAHMGPWGNRSPHRTSGMSMSHLRCAGNFLPPTSPRWDYLNHVLNMSATSMQDSHWISMRRTLVGIAA